MRRVLEFWPATVTETAGKPTRACAASNTHESIAPEAVSARTTLRHFWPAIVPATNRSEGDQRCAIDAESVPKLDPSICSETGTGPVTAAAMGRYTMRGLKALSSGGR